MARNLGTSAPHTNDSVRFEYVMGPFFVPLPPRVLLLGSGLLGLLGLRRYRKS